MFKEFTRGHVEVEVDGKAVTVPGELLVSGPGVPDYVIEGSSITGWDPPNDALPFSEIDKVKVLEEIKRGFEDRKMTYKVE